MSEQADDPRVALLAELLEADFGWAIEAGWEATAASMLAKVDALTAEDPR